MSGRISRFFFAIPQEQDRLKYSPVAGILSSILLRQTLPLRVLPDIKHRKIVCGIVNAELLRRFEIDELEWIGCSRGLLARLMPLSMLSTWVKGLSCAGPAAPSAATKACRHAGWLPGESRHRAG